ncbi:alpha/beta fold hydrolase [Vibrio parahaemolyticus]|uniref:alpha/beta fold hydrolase n=1 Tax=Vibrio parahaemolyticus TaxID=670 RepID=UPI00235EFB05|nr:alpha/beta hydrolase [Vibrio parahaemolyticus]
MQVTLSNQAVTYIHQEVFGTGEPILFLHGGPGCCHDSYAPFFKPLAERHQVIYFDQIGCGKSDWNINFDYKINHDIEVIEAIRKKLGYASLTIVGESWGTYLGLQYASLHPDKVKTLILLSCVGYNHKHLTRFGELLQSKLTPIDQKALEDLEREHKENSIDVQQYSKQCQDIYNKYYLYDVDNASLLIDQPINFEHHYRVVNLFDEQLDFIQRKDTLKRVDIHMYQAEHDIITPREITKTLVAQIEPTSFTRVPDCGHWLYLEQKDYINTEITRIVADNKLY